MTISFLAVESNATWMGAIDNIVGNSSHQVMLIFSDLANNNNNTSPDWTNIPEELPPAEFPQEAWKIISDDLRSLFELINYAFILGTVSFFGIVGNVINLVVFVRQGFGDSVNISLFALAISDIGCLLTMLWQSICYNWWFASSPIVPFKSVEIQYITGGWPHICFTRITTWITFFITVERCLCITMPLKVKQVITHRRTVIIIVTIYILMMGSIAPVFYTTRLGEKFYPDLNRTLIGQVYTKDREEVDRISFAVNNVFLRILSFTGIIIFTAILVVKLKSKTKWRMANAGLKGGNQSDPTSSSVRDMRIVKMITLISTVFLVCFFPVTVIFVGMILEPEFNIGAKFQNLHYFLCSFTFVMEGVSSSINIIIYHRMSTKYRENFTALFCRDKITKGIELNRI